MMELTTANKAKVQQEALDSWIEAGMKGTIVLPTGTGKTKILIDAADYLVNQGNKNILIAAPTRNIKEREIPSELKKWNKEHLKDYIKVECFKTAYKLEEPFDAVLIDEIHLCASTMYRAILDFSDKILGLTATVPENSEYLMLLLEKAPIIYRMGVSDAKKLELISDFRVVNVLIEMSPAKKALYKRIQNDLANIATALVGTPNIGAAFGFAQGVMQKKVRAEGYMYPRIRKFYDLIRQRKNFCYNSSDKKIAVFNILSWHPNKKVIVFGESIDFMNELKDYLEGTRPVYIYHSKSSSKNTLEEFKNSSNGVLLTVRALDTGFNVEDVEVGIITAGSSRKLQFIQRLGRLVRVKQGKQAVIYNLCLMDTQDEVWSAKRLAGVKDYEVIEI